MILGLKTSKWNLLCPLCPAPAPCALHPAFLPSAWALPLGCKNEGFRACPCAPCLPCPWPCPWSWPWSASLPFPLKKLQKCDFWGFQPCKPQNGNLACPLCPAPAPCLRPAPCPSLLACVALPLNLPLSSQKVGNLATLPSAPVPCLLDDSHDISCFEPR